MTTRSPLPDESLLREIEAVAVELAQLGGAEIRAALGGLLRVKYKGMEGEGVEGGQATFRDPVSEVDARVEALIRERLAERFPRHDIVGEEIDHRPGLGHDFLWAVDPIDGTANFINGFPLFASSVGVLSRAWPVAGAVGCSASPALEPGVYHGASAGDGGVRFNGVPLDVTPNPAIRRRLGGEPWASRHSTQGWDGRKTGSAAIECAFVAAGLLQMAWFERPNIWDVAGGTALVLAAGLHAMERRGGGWTAFDGFSTGDLEPGAWVAPLAIGDADALERFVESGAG